MNNSSSGTIYASIGNSDDKLSQTRWAAYLDEFLRVIRGTATAIHGEWYSAPRSAYQNACVCFELNVAAVADLQTELTELRREYGQDSIAWAATYQTIFI